MDMMRMVEEDVECSLLAQDALKEYHWNIEVMKASTKSLSCPGCGKRLLKIEEKTCSKCGFAGIHFVMLTTEEREEIKRKYDRTIAATKLNPDYDQAQFEEDVYWLYGKRVGEK